MGSSRVDRKRTDRRDDIMRFIEDFIAEHKYPPTHRDIVAGVGICLSNVNRYLNLLEAAGKIRRVPHLARSIVIVSRGE